MVPEKLIFSPLARRRIEADFSGGHITSDAGLLLLREVDKQHRLTRRLASVLQDPRTPEMVRHSWAILALLVRFIRQYWPDTRIVFRGDSGFSRPRILSWCDRNKVPSPGPV